MGKMKASVTDTVGDATPSAEPALIVFGRDDAQKAHASWFGAVDADLAEKAAGIMGMSVLRVRTPDHRAAALGLAPGRVFASGKGFVPFTKEAAYEALAAFEGAFNPPPPVEAVPEPALAFTGVPSRWEDIGEGALVLAAESPEQPWYPAIVAEDRGEGLFVLRWRDFADEPKFARRADALALLPAMFANAAASTPAG